MKFSVLLPTRNRLEYLRYAVESVLRQDYNDWEIIVSDNFSEQDIAGYVNSLADPRVKYYRTDGFVPVTDNWNNALDKSTGDYVIMLGDDDSLMKGYFKTMRRLIEEYREPDFVFTNASIYAYPSALPDAPDGVLRPFSHAVFADAPDEPFLLDRERALAMVENSMGCNMQFYFNMQFSAISRKFIGTLSGGGEFFQSPFPDFYATNVMFLKAERILIYPRAAVTIGITPKSYGFYYFNAQEAGGVKFLNSLFDPETARRLQGVLLPGSNMNTSWLFAMEAIRANYGSEFDLRVNYRRYRYQQIAHVYELYYLLGAIPKEKLRELQAQLRLWERVKYGGKLAAAFSFRWFLRQWLSPLQRARLAAAWRLVRYGQLPRMAEKKTEQRYRNILEVFEELNPLGG